MGHHTIDIDRAAADAAQVLTAALRRADEIGLTRCDTAGELLDPDRRARIAREHALIRAGAWA